MCVLQESLTRSEAILRNRLILCLSDDTMMALKYACMQYQVEVLLYRWLVFARQKCTAFVLLI